jgi:hypothetical protein
LNFKNQTGAMFKSSEEDRFKWKERIQLYEASNHEGSIAGWCRSQQISYDSFLYWKSKFGSKASRQGSFKELFNPNSIAGLTIECHSVKIHLSHNFDEATLVKCLKILKGNLC